MTLSSTDGTSTPFASVPAAVPTAAGARPLEGKRIVIVGGTTGLGLSAATACLKAGARLVLVGRDEESCDEAKEAFGAPTVVLCGDATLAETSEAAVTAAIEAHGGLDGLYHVAGGSGRRHGDGPLHELTNDGWDRTLALNLNSVMYSNRAAVRQFLSQRSAGSILNMGSVLGFAPSPKFFSTHAYAAAKAAIEGFSMSIASYYAPKNIRVNVLAPALVQTPMSRRAMTDERIQSFVASKQPLDGGRVGVPSDLDAAALFFLGDGSRFCTGQVLAVDGGWCLSDGQWQTGEEGA